MSRNDNGANGKKKYLFKSHIINISKSNYMKNTHTFLNWSQN